MKKKIFNSENEWLYYRRGKITGTRVNAIKTKDGKGKEFWEILAERVAIPANEENVIERGKRLEHYAIERFAEVTSNKINNELIMWVSDKDERIACSPDGEIENENSAVEVKCLSSGLHLEAYFTKDYPKSSTLYKTYKAQARQYFQVNDKLEKLYVVFYDPRCPIDMHYITIERKDIEKELEDDLLDIQTTLSELDRLEAEIINI